MTTTVEQARDLFDSPAHAGCVADGIEGEIDEALAKLEQLAPAQHEIRTRVARGMLDDAARTDISDDMLHPTGSVTEFALAVAA